MVVFFRSNIWPYFFFSQQQIASSAPGWKFYAGDTTLCSKCDQASDLSQQLELAAELEFDLRDTVDWVKKQLVDFDAGKTQLVSFDQYNNNGCVDVKMDGSVLEEKSFFKMLGLTFTFKLD